VQEQRPQFLDLVLEVQEVDLLLEYGCGGNGGSGAGSGPYYGQAGRGGYIKLTMY